MKKINIERTGDILYSETLDNGLQIFMIPKTSVNTTMVSFNVKYGAIHSDFIPRGENKMIHVPHGIAHFLEHKMFEQENGVDPMLFYANNGADVNAYTSPHNTAYFFISSSHLKENLEYLLNFVQSPYFTDENVEKEKGIIEEEIKMYDDDPYSFLGEQLRMNAFTNNPVRYTVAGTIDDIRSITKEQLYTCYHTFYHPSNMFITVTGNFNVDEVLNIIKENQSSKSFDEPSPITIKKFKEEDKVSKEYEEKQMNVEVPKIAVGIKIDTKDIDMETRRLNLYLAIILDSLLGATSTFNEEMRDKEYLLSYIVFDSIIADDYILYTISADTEYADELIEEIKKKLSNINIDADDFSDKIKMLISNDIYTYDSVEETNALITQSLIIYGKYQTNTDKMLETFSIDELNNLITKLNLSNITVMVVKPIGE